MAHARNQTRGPPALGLKRERTEGRKREKFYIYSDVTHTQKKKITKLHSFNLKGPESE